MANNGHQYLLLRSGRYYYYRRKPFEVTEALGPGFVRISLKTTDLKTALSRRDIVHRDIEQYWHSIIKFGHQDSARTQYDSAVKIAQSMGFHYQPADVIARELPTPELLARLEKIEQTGIEKRAVVAALAGGVAPPAITMTEAFDEFVRLTRDWLTDKSDEQIRRWQNPRKKAVKNWSDVTGNPELARITRSDALKFRDWWWDRIENEQMTVNSANKDFGHIHQIFEKVNEGLQLGLDDPLARLRFREKKKNARPPYSPEYITQRILKPGALDTLHPECRALIMIIMNTGAGPAELAGMIEDDIILDADIPHFHIRENSERSLKTMYRPRTIPLAGVAFDAFKELVPKGFIDYRNKPTQLSANTNRHLTDNDLRESDDHSVYSLRHSFQDALTKAEAPDRIQADLMGHKFHRPKYGDGASLEQKYRWIKKVAY
ncbi:DUF6538 domain-containing protein [Thalassospira marina]|uniref:Integrase n=1 Tax=Thalassospira marina TaxID=2048283 RepID=A0A2N3KJN3_9PROT|nr:DUF6538 domain-containing protein [Thalassospira marina]PKR50748.1 integrase [Thalassospira marina]